MRRFGGVTGYRHPTEAKRAVRLNVQRETLTGQLSELEATERVLARYSKGTRAKKTASAKAPTTATKAARALRRQNQLVANAPRRPSASRSLP